MTIIDLSTQVCHDNSMPKGSKGQKRPADVIGAAIMVAKIATGKIAMKAAKKRWESDT